MHVAFVFVTCYDSSHDIFLHLPLASFCLHVTNYFMWAHWELTAGKVGFKIQQFELKNVSTSTASLSHTFSSTFKMLQIPLELSFPSFQAQFATQLQSRMLTSEVIFSICNILLPIIFIFPNTEHDPSYLLKMMEPLPLYVCLQLRWVQPPHPSPGYIQDGRRRPWRTRVCPPQPAAPHCWHPSPAMMTSRNDVSAEGRESLTSKLPLTPPSMTLHLTGKLKM